MVLVLIIVFSIFALSYLYITNKLFIFVYDTLCILLGVLSFKRNDCILMKRAIFTYNNYIAKEYNIVYNEKNHDLVFIAESDKIDLQIKDFFSNISKILALKNLIVYCGIKKEGIIEDDIDIDVTEIFRYFVYYYDKDTKLDIFLKYILTKGAIQDSVYNVYSKYNIYNEYSEYNEYNGYDYFDINSEFDKYSEYSFVLYLNDSDFTEIVYSMKSIKDLKFKELLFKGRDYETYV